MKKAGLLLGFGVVAAGLAAVFWPSKASASPLTDSEPTPGEGVFTPPKSAEEAYGLAMNPKLKDPEYVHRLALWLASSGQRPDFAAAAEKRVQDLRAEQVLAHGLQVSTDLAQVKADGDTLVATHPQYTTVLGMRIMVQTGQKAPPPPFNLDLASGGTLAIDLSIYAPSQQGGQSGPVGPAAGGNSSPAPVPSAPSAPVTNMAPVPAPVATPSAAGVPVPSPSPSPSAATPSAAAPAPITQAEQAPAVDPNGTIALARLMLDEQEKPGWKYVSNAVKAWQAKVGLTADGKFGAGSALRMAREVSVLPWVRYWSLGVGDGSKQAALADYRSRLQAYALSLPASAQVHAAALIRAAQVEKGQGWPNAPAKAPIPPLTDEDAAAAAEILKSLKKGK